MWSQLLNESLGENNPYTHKLMSNVEKSVQESRNLWDNWWKNFKKEIFSCNSELMLLLIKNLAL